MHGTIMVINKTSGQLNIVECTAYCSTSEASSIWTIMADGQQLVADRLKKTILLSPTCIWHPHWMMISSSRFLASEN